MLADVVHLMHVTSKEQVVDILTKSLHPGQFNNLQAKLEIIDTHSSLIGDVKCKGEEENVTKLVDRESK